MLQTGNHILHLLQKWYPLKDEMEWVLGVIYKTEGSCYRKAGAMMLFSDLGHQFGVLSGGCLEKNVRNHAQKVMVTGEPVSLRYDDKDEDDVAYQLGVGCGGVVYLKLLPVNKLTHYLALDKVYKMLSKGDACCWMQNFVDSSKAINTKVSKTLVTKDKQKTKIIKREDTIWLYVCLTPPPHILIIGGGVDAIPMTQFATQLGWQVSLWDPRPGYARKDFFPHVNTIVKLEQRKELKTYAVNNKVDAAILMSHHKTIDAQALNALHDCSLRYLALLGPAHRKEEIVELAKVETENIDAVFSGPAGFDIGCDLPESIALSILAECHSIIYKGTGQALSYAALISNGEVAA